MAVAKKPKSVGDVVKFVESSVSVNETNSDMARIAEMTNSLKNLKVIQTPELSKEINELKMFCNSSLDSLANSIVSKLGVLENIDKAIAFQQENLTRIYNITVAANTLEALILSQETQKKAFEDEMTAVKQQWSRDQEAYKYQLQLDKRKDADEFTNFKKTRTEELEKMFKDKMQTILEKEAVLNNMKVDYETAISNAAGFDNKLGFIVTEKEKEITEKLTKENNYQVRLLQKDSENAVRLADHTINSLRARVTELEKQIADVRAQESKAIERVQQIAEKAIDGATKQTVLIPNSQNEQSNYSEKLRK